MKIITIWSLLKSAEDPGKRIYHDSVSRFREMIIRITSFVPLRETKEEGTVIIPHILKWWGNKSIQCDAQYNQ